MCVKYGFKMTVTISIYLDERVKKKNDFYPVKLRVTHDRKRYYLSINANRINTLLQGNLEEYKYLGREGYSMRKAVYEKVTALKPRGAFKDLHNIFKTFEIEYQRQADAMSPFVFEKFKERYGQSNKSNKNDVFTQLVNKIALLKSEDRFNSASAYESARSALKGFHNKNELSFDAITPKFLSQFNKWMLAHDKSQTTSSIYLRSLRSLFNDSIGDHITTNYPFHNKQNKSGFKIPAGKGRKIALSSNELKTIFTHVPDKKDPGRFYVDSWKLLYLLQGINPTDLCNLRYTNLKGDFFELTRAKTKNSKPTMIRIPINEQIKNILDLWAKPKTSENDFIWPVIKSVSKEKQHAEIKQFVKLTNKYINRLAGQLKIDKHITTYVTRHSFATQLMRYGAPVAFISQQLGHNSTKTTDNYLNSFEDDQLKKWQDKISNFE